MGERVEDVHSGLVTVSGHDAGSGLFVVGTHSRMGERVEDAGSGLLAGLLWTGTHSRILISALPGDALWTSGRLFTKWQLGK